MDAQERRLDRLEGEAGKEDEPVDIFISLNGEDPDDANLWQEGREAIVRGARNQRMILHWPKSEG